MPFYTRGDVTIHYEESGSGYPVLLFAPGLMRSSISRWEHSDLKPLEVLASGYRVIAMDQRNAGESRAPIKATDGWSDYAQDASGLIDQLGLGSLAVWGLGIGPSFCMKVIEQLGSQADRVTAFIDHAPIGLNAINRGHYMHGFYQWAEELHAGTFPEPVSVDPTCASFCENLFGSEFAFSVGRVFVRSMQTPTLVLPGRDLAHPEEIALETARLAPNAELKLGWQQDLPAAASAVRLFLQAHTRVSTSEASPGQATWTNEQIVAPQVPVFISRERGADGGLRAISRVQAWTILKVVSEQADARALALRASHHGAAGEPASAHPHLFRHSRVRQIVSTTRSLPLGTCHPSPRRGIHVRGKTCLALTGGERTPLAGKGSSW